MNRDDQKTANEWKAYAGETITTRRSGDTIDAFGSELACLRLFYMFRYAKDARIEYSKNLKTWVFSLTAPHRVTKQERLAAYTIEQLRTYYIDVLGYGVDDLTT